MTKNQFRVLIVDDSEDMQDLSKHILTNAATKSGGAIAFEIDIACHGSEALVKIDQSYQQKKPYDVVLSDVHIPPGMDGFTMAKKVYEKYPLVEFIFFSSLDQMKWEDVYQLFGINYRIQFLTKPAKEITLVQMVLAQASRFRLNPTS